MIAKRKPKDERVHDRKSTDLLINSIVAEVVVTDPAGDKIAVMRSLRDDALAWLQSRHQIDEAQFIAGRHWQRLHQSSTIGMIRAIDPTKDAVDGGQMPEAITDKQIDAFRELADSYKALGAYGGRLVFEILGEGRGIAEAAALRGCQTELETKYLGRRFRECLETLAVHWGYAAPKYPQR